VLCVLTLAVVGVSWQDGAGPALYIAAVGLTFPTGLVYWPWLAYPLSALAGALEVLAPWAVIGVFPVGVTGLAVANVFVLGFLFRLFGNGDPVNLPTVGAVSVGVPRGPLALVWSASVAWRTRMACTIAVARRGSSAAW
jgi:hypothetical protein